MSWKARLEPSMFCDSAHAKVLSRRERDETGQVLGAMGIQLFMDLLAYFSQIIINIYFIMNLI